MARARNIKPGFFANEDLVELDFATRLLFIGLWTIADRAGRLEDRPKRVKMALFPADDLNIDDSLSQLQASGFILRYEVDGSRYIQILAFDKHQNPHRDEKPSSIPAPKEHGASTVQAPCKDDANPADSLIPDSLIPDSGLPSKATRVPRFDAQAHLLSLGIPPDLSSDWIKLRKAKKAEVTKTAIEGIEGEALKAGFSLDKALRECCSRGWAGFKADWILRDSANARASPGYKNIHDQRAETIAALTGRDRNERTTERDITGEARVVAG